MGMFTSKSRSNVQFKRIFSIGIQQLIKKYFSTWLCTCKIPYMPLAACDKEKNIVFVLTILVSNIFLILTLIISLEHSLKIIQKYSCTLKG